MEIAKCLDEMVGRRRNARRHRTRGCDRFKDRDHFAAYNGTAPIEASSGPRKIYRLSRKGNRRLNHAIHMAAVTRVSHPHGPAAPTTTARSQKETPARKPRGHSSDVISDVVYAALVTDGALQTKAGPGGQTGSVSDSSATGSHPAKPALRTSHSRTPTKPTTSRASQPRPRPAAARKCRRASCTQRGLVMPRGDLGGRCGSALVFCVEPNLGV